MISLLFFILGLLAGRVVVRKYPKLDELISGLIHLLRTVAVDAYHGICSLLNRKKKDKHVKQDNSKASQ